MEKEFEFEENPTHPSDDVFYGIFRFGNGGHIANGVLQAMS